MEEELYNPMMSKFVFAKISGAHPSHAKEKNKGVVHRKAPLGPPLTIRSSLLVGDCFRLRTSPAMLQK